MRGFLLLGVLMIEKSTLYLQQFLTLLNLANWVVNFTLIIFITLIVQLMWRAFSKKTQVIIDRSANHWDDIAWFAIWRPVNWLIMLIGGSMALRIVAQSEELVISNYLPLIQKISVLMLAGWAFLRLINKAESTFVDHDDKDTTTVTAMAKLAKLSVAIIATLSIIQTLGVSITGVLTFGGMGGLVVGMAAKDLLSNLFGALMVYLDKPFKVGDWIRSPDKSIEGTVEDIGWRVTRIRTFDKRPLYVPNSLFTNIVVENPSRMSNRRIKENFGLRYRDISQVETIIHEVREMLVNHPEIDASQTLMVNFNLFNNSSLDFFIYTFTKTTNWVEFHHIKQDVLLKVADIVAHNNAEFAFPTQQLHISQQ